MNQNPRPVRILGSGTSVPGRKISHEELDRELGLPKGTTLRETGIVSRYLTTTETAAEIAATACRNALEAAQLTWDDIDCLVATSGTADQALPYNAAMIHAELGLCKQRTTTFDIGASCMSFLTGLDVTSYLIAAGRFERILLVSADISTFTVSFRNLKENGIFGDGAAAFIIGKAKEGESSAILASSSITLSEGVNYCRIQGGGSRFHRRTAGSKSEALFEMNGKSVFGLVAKELPGFVKNLFAQTGLEPNQIDLAATHQASHLALKHAARLLRLDKDKMVNIFPSHGNQVGASLPTALHHGIEQHQLKRGAKILLLGSGAGVTLGGMILVY